MNIQDKIRDLEDNLFNYRVQEDEWKLRDKAHRIQMDLESKSQTIQQIDYKIQSLKQQIHSLEQDEEFYRQNRAHHNQYERDDLDLTKQEMVSYFESKNKELQNSWDRVVQLWEHLYKNGYFEAAQDAIRGDRYSKTFLANANLDKHKFKNQIR